MSDTEQQPESQKTIIAFIAGLLIGGLLVWVFAGGTPAEAPTIDEEPASDTTSDEEMDEEEDETSEMSDENDTAKRAAAAESDHTTPAADMETGDGSISVESQPAGSRVAIEGAVFPNDEGWIGVRDYDNGQMSGLLGVARFSKEQGLVPEEIPLLRATEAGNEYAVVFYTESGDREFSLANDVQIPDVMATFTAQ